jgi:hypothetical protein
MSLEHPKAREWRHPLLLATGGLLLFETLTGLSIWLLGFSAANQVMVLLHTVAGLVFLLPGAWYQVRHWNRYRANQISSVLLTGYFALIAVVVACISGVVLTWQATFGTRISYAWDLVHIISTVALIVSVAPHLVPILGRLKRAPAQDTVAPVRRAARVFGYGSVVVTALLLLVVVAGVAFIRPVPLDNSFPEEYNYLYGEDRPFAPSLAKTETGGAYDPQSMGGSESCGTVGCHSEIAEEWSVSAHRWSAMDPAFKAVQDIMAQQNGPESTRYCGGCHDPISLFSGSKNLFTDDLTNAIGHDEGVSCVVCHAIVETDVQGNANYVIRQPERYLLEMQDGPLATFASNFLIRAYPKQHIESLQHTLFKSPEFCAACHKQFIDEEINNVGWVQLQNQYDNWRQSRWNHPGDPEKTIECRECHMPLVDSFDPASGDALDYNRDEGDRKHRSHRFLGGNQMMPTLLELEGGVEQVQLTEDWLRGDLMIPEIAHKWMEGPAVPIVLHVPDEARAGEEAQIQVEIVNNKLGHDFPTGPLDIIQAWVEVTVTDSEGNELFRSGERDDDHFIEPGTFMFKAEPVDQYGNLIDRHNLWEMVGVRYRRALFPGFSDRATYTFSCPSDLAPAREAIDPESVVDFRVPPEAGSELTVTARLLYRKVDQYMINTLFGPDSGLTSPVTELSRVVETIPIASP